MTETLNVTPVEVDEEEDIRAERLFVETHRKDAEVANTPTKPEDYVIIDGVYRCVKPYYFDFLCSIKQRWAGDSVVDIFAREFPARRREYYSRAVVTGRLRRDRNQTLHPDTILKEGDRMLHFLHRHEPSVPATEIDVLGTCGDLVAVSKPAGMPVHVSGQYRKNTVLGILQATKPELFPLLPVHRLDKPVSGVLLLAKDAGAADSLRLGIADKGHVEKTYVARVQGVFPTNDENNYIIADVSLGWDSVSGSAFVDPDRVYGEPPNGCMYDSTTTAFVPELTEMTPLSKRQAKKAERKLHRKRMKQDNIEMMKTQSTNNNMENATKTNLEVEIHKEPTAEILPSDAPQGSKTRNKNSRPAKTIFRLLSIAPDRKTSLVECRPLTGRSHQIRAHLSYLGYPIANDGQYGGQYDGPQGIRNMALSMGIAWDKGGGVGHVIPKTTYNMTKSDDEGGKVFEQNSANDSPRLKSTVFSETSNMRSLAKYEAPKELHDPLCPHCPYYAPHNYPIDIRPLWLHAARYSCLEWAFEAPYPEWARADWIPD